MAVTVLLSILTLVMLVSSDSGTWTLIEEDSSKVHHVAENLSMNKSKGQQTKAARQDPDTHAWLHSAQTSLSNTQLLTQFSCATACIDVGEMFAGQATEGPEPEPVRTRRFCSTEAGAQLWESQVLTH